MKIKVIAFILFISLYFIFAGCNTYTGNKTAATGDSATSNPCGGFATQEEWGKHIVTIVGCGDCHTPKNMTAQGPVNDPAMDLAGCPSDSPLPELTSQQLAKGMAATTDQTAWTGPWGKSFAANITSDSTGIGAWKEQQFIDCLRKGLLKGLANTRPLMPPMPWQDYSKMSDAEIKAVFVYLKSTKPVHNIVPQYKPPVAAMK